jgi:membrane protease YdiL (CAAX protease family)
MAQNQPSVNEPDWHEKLDVSAPLPGPLRAIAWLSLFVAILVFSTFVYASLLGGFIAIAYPEAVQNDSLFDSTLSELIWSPAGLAWSTTLDFLLVVPAILWASNFRTQSWRETLALRAAPWQAFGFWLLMFCGLALVQFVLSFLVEMDNGELLERLSGSRHMGVFLAFVFLGPVIEELIFRGYLFRAWRYTRLGMAGTVLLTSVMFTVIHSYQYPFSTLASIFALSLLLGLAREKTDSLWVPIGLHIVNNAIAMAFLLFVDI